MTCSLLRPATPTWSLCVSSSTNVATAGWGSSALRSQTTPWWRRPSVCLHYKLHVHVAQHADHFRVVRWKLRTPWRKWKIDICHSCSLMELLTSDRCNAQADAWLMMCSFFPVLSTMVRNCKLSQFCLKPHACIQVFVFLLRNQTSALNCIKAPCCSVCRCVTLHTPPPQILTFSVVTLWLMHCFLRQIRNHLCWGPHPWDLYSWKELQARQQLPVALQAVIPSRWHEQEDHTLCGGRWRWQQGRSDQQNDQEDELS